MTITMNENDVRAANAPVPQVLQPLTASSKNAHNKNTAKTTSTAKKSKKKKKRRAAEKSLKSLDNVLKDQSLCGCGNKMASKCTNKQCVACCTGCPRHKKADDASKTKKTTKKKATTPIATEPKLREPKIAKDEVAASDVNSDVVVQPSLDDDHVVVAPDNKKGKAAAAVEPTSAKKEAFDSALSLDDSNKTAMTPNRESKRVYVVVEGTIVEDAVVGGSPLYPNIPVETVDVQDEDDAAVVPIDIGGQRDILGSFIRAIASFPNFCPE